MQSQQTGYDMQGEGAIILADVKAINPKKTANRDRLMCAQFIIMHYTMEAMSIGMAGQQPEMDPTTMQPLPPSNAPPPIDEELLEKFKVAQREDMLLAWSILSARGFNNPELAKAAAVLKIDIAQRLEDSVKLADTFNTFTKIQLQPQDLMVACTAAPFLANWQAARNLVKRAEKLMGKQMLEMQWHQMSQSMPIPDYSVLFKLADAAKLSKRQTPDPKTLVWSTIAIGKIRVKFDSVDCGPFPDKAQELLTEISKQPILWEEITNTANVQIKRMGGFYQSVSFGEMPMSLCGPVVDEETIHIKGHMELVLATDPNQPPPQYQHPSQVDPSKLVVQQEEWKITLVPNTSPRVWVGTYKLDQGPVKCDPKNPETAPVNMGFKLELYEQVDGKVHEVVEECKEEATAALEAADEKSATAAANATAGTLETTDAKTAEKTEQTFKSEVGQVMTEIDGLSMD